ncbi:hypothetical protein BTA51_01135 [Hahella sp. CCB-MM4]|uniref:hypothetical protein n=1 Tax=Hahella sp. (strain CCB-MM4) TaxID=1926491 RepID=UPI000B9A2907|nr:hypothetical protein [Hahella sp. CCB-MM4]OZG75036.1 hypothetical protein BTA51_01135 [Hahella sp. CCB-MM4]
MQSYEMAECHSDDDPKGDVFLQCGISPTVKKLAISIIESEKKGRQYFARLRVENTNLYPVLVKTLMVTGRNAEGEPVSFFGNQVKIALRPGDSVETTVSGVFPELLHMPGVDINMTSIDIMASPW